jgi:hypothetical protein
MSVANPLPGSLNTTRRGLPAICVATRLKVSAMWRLLIGSWPSARPFATTSSVSGRELPSRSRPSLL